METVSSKTPRIVSILGGKKPSEWLENNGFIRHENLGWVKRDRLDNCLQKGYVRHDYEKGVVFTELGSQHNFMDYLWGDSDVITKKQTREEQRQTNRQQRTTNKTKREAKPMKASDFFTNL